MTYRRMTDHIRGQGRADGSRMAEYSFMSAAKGGVIAIYIRGKLADR